MCSSDLLAMFANKYRKQLTGYDTQAAYEAAREERIANKRLDKITDRMISGKNYGNYEDALLDSGADRKSTRLNSSHLVISYAVFCLKKKKNKNNIP